MYRIYSLLAICLCAIHVKAQDNPNAELEAFVPPSVTTPEAATLGKFGEIPVSYYTGVPDISIPLYTVQVNGFELPIVLRYHSSGVQVAEEATWVGLGWDLSVGGSITHNAVGENDDRDPFRYTDIAMADINLPAPQTLPYHQYYKRRETHSMPPSRCPMADPADPNLTDRRWMFDQAMNLGHGQPDNFTVNIPGASGKFILERITLTPKLVGSVSQHIEITGSQSTSWKVRDMNGVEYYFDADDEEYIHQNPGRLYAVDPETTISKLSKIRLQDLSSEILFDYEDGYFEIDYGHSKYITFSNEDPRTEQTMATWSKQHVKYLSEINTDHERIVFELSSNKADRKDLKGNILNNEYTAKRLNAIHIYNKINNKLIKSFEFGYGYFDSGNTSKADHKRYRLKLNSVKEIGYSDSEVRDESKPAYKFTYNNQQLPDKDSYAVDHWGYYNGRSNTSLLPNVKEEIFTGTTHVDLQELPIPIIQFVLEEGDANRGMDPLKAKAGILTEIKYPTGGSSAFEYEANTFTNYLVFDASEISTGSGWFDNTNLHDNNKSFDVLTATIHPDEDGSIGLYDLSYGFSKQASVDPSTFNDAWVKVERVSANGVITELEKWVITDMEYFRDNHIFEVEDQYIWLSGSADDEYRITVHLPDIDDLITPDYQPLGTVWCNFKAINYQESKTESIGGGLRIASITNKDADLSFISKETYSYTDENGLSTGKLMSPINYIGFDNDYLHVFKGSNQIVYNRDGYKAGFGTTSYMPISNHAQGSVVGYDRVEVIKTDQSGSASVGKQVYYYRNTPPIYSGLTSMVGIPHIPYDDNGLLDSLVFYETSTPGNFNRVRKILHTYSSANDSKSYGVIVEDASVLNQLECDDLVRYPLVPERFWIHYYPIQSWYYRTEGTTEINYSSSEDFTTITTYAYNNLGQTTQKSTTDSFDDFIDQYFIHPSDEPDVYSDMVSRHLLNPVVESYTERKGSETTRSKFVYSSEDVDANSIRLVKIERSNKGQPFYDVVSDINYDISDNVKQVEQDGVITTYLWGYNYRYIVFKAVGVTFDELVDHSSIGSYSALQTKTDAQLESIGNQLRSAFQQALITTYKYKPGIGPYEVIDEKGLKTFFKYDEFGRLKQVKDQEENTLQEVKYNYGSN